MAYRIKLDEENVLKKMERLPVSIEKCVRENFRLLGTNPAKYSVKAHFPHPLDGQLFHWECFVSGETYYFTAMFRYFQETELHVAWLVFQKRTGG